MNTFRIIESAFPLSAGTPPRPVLRAPALPVQTAHPVGFALGRSAFNAAWSGRRARLSLSPLMRLK
ncbi:MAG: hypothetical protein WCQ89_00395 [Verrucomicrobiota bacterium]